jgi:hypothetical protein
MNSAPCSTLPWSVLPAPAPPALVVCTDLLAQGLAWLTKQLQAHAATTVVYRRGGESLSVCATLGRTLLKLDDGLGGTRLEWTDKDFLIPGEALILGGSVALPRRGDLIRQTIGTTTWVYEVLAPGDEPPWRWSDPYQRMLRVHTKHVATEVA